MKKILFLTACAAMFACKREGCTDRDAQNFDAKAKKDNSTCQFGGLAVFWYDKATADSLVADDATALTYYIDGQVVASQAAVMYWTGAPSCGQAGSATFTRDLGGAKSKAYSYSVKDQTGFEYWKGTINLEANTCNALRLTW